MSLDQIVEMCDELIAAHGDLLPKLDSKKTLVPIGEKSFGPVDPRTLRKSWDEAHARRTVDYIPNWHVIGPFKDSVPEQISLDLTTPVEGDFARSADGSVDLKKTYANGSGAALQWVKASARRKGNVNFDDTIGRHEFAVAYGYTEVESIHPRDAVLRCGSDDGIRIWINGKLVHDHKVRRGFAADSDRVPIHLKAGRNFILVKIDNYRAGWGFGVAISKPTF